MNCTCMQICLECVHVEGERESFCLNEASKLTVGMVYTLLSNLLKIIAADSFGFCIFCGEYITKNG